MADLPFERAIVVLDTSVILKWYRQGEVLADRALRIRDAYLRGQIAIAVPSLLAYELANVLRYKSDLSTDQIQQAVSSLFDMDLVWTTPSSETLHRAVEIARNYETTVYDAAFAALAEALDAAFVTADESLARHLETSPAVYFLGELTE